MWSQIKSQAAASGFGSRSSHGKANLHTNTRGESCSFKLEPQLQGESRSFTFLEAIASREKSQLQVLEAAASGRDSKWVTTFLSPFFLGFLLYL